MRRRYKCNNVSGKSKNHVKEQTEYVSKNNDVVDYNVELKKGIIREYDMVRNQIDNAIARMDKYYIQAVAVLLLGVFFQRNANAFLLAMGLLVTLTLQLKILECKNMVSYNAAYLMVFIENRKMGLMYETRVQQYRMKYWDSNNKYRRDRTKKRTRCSLKESVGKFGYRIKNAMVGAFALIVIACFYRNNLNLNFVFCWDMNTLIYCSKFIGLSLLALANVIFAIYLCIDKKKPQEMAEEWKKIKAREEQ